MKVILLGGTGLTGSLLASLLAKESSIEKVTLPGRSVPSFTHPKIEFVKSDLLSPDLKFEAADVVFCCLGTTIKKAGSREAFLKVDVEMPANAARAAAEAGIPVFVLVSALGANTASSVFYNRAKGQAEQRVCLPGMKTFVFRPSILTGQRAEFRLGERIGIAFSLLISPFLIGPLAKYKPTNASILARAMYYSAVHASRYPEIKVFDGTAEILSIKTQV